jgi:hypothetical protein
MQSLLAAALLTAPLAAHSQAARKSSSDPIYSGASVSQKWNFSLEISRKNFETIILKYTTMMANLCEVAPHDYETFWTVVEATSPDYVAYNNNKNGSWTRNYREDFTLRTNSTSFLYDDLPSLYPDDQNVSTWLEGFRSTTKCPRGIYVYDDALAKTRPDGIILVGTPLLERLSTNELLAVVAHENTHYMLEHALISGIKDHTIRKREKFRAGVGAALNSLDAALDDAQHGKDYTYVDRVVKRQVVDEVNSSYWRAAKIREELKSYSYGRSQEIEADVVACLYCWFDGIPVKSLKTALSKIARSEDYIYDDRSDHPSVEFRYAMIDYLEQHLKVMDARRALYEQAKGKYVKEDHFAEFVEDMLYRPGYSKKVYNTLSKNGLITESFQDFSERLAW